jgi:NadR type nicotinamide-nucleotide adenylyltransferase
MLLGKFMPPHLGHVHLAEFASRVVDQLTIVVCSIAAEPIPGEYRFAWMRELFPRANVVHLTEELPQHPSEHPDFWPLWHASLTRVLPGRPDFVFAGEDYGAKLAETLGAKFLPLFRSQGPLAVSGTQIRTQPLESYDLLPRCVRPYFVRRVCVFGPESTGKTTLAHRLAELFDTVAVPEYARMLLEARNGELRQNDMPHIARGQVAVEDALARDARNLLFCDTDALTTRIWSETLYGDCDPSVIALANERDYDLTLLLDVDVPWVADPVRYLPNDREDFFLRCRRALAAQGRRTVEIRGTWEERLDSARRAVEELLATPLALGRRRHGWT